jgi:hypothetical protein
MRWSWRRLAGGPGGVGCEVPVASRREERLEDRIHGREEKHNE